MNHAAPAARTGPFVVGRDAERARVDAFAATLHEGPRALVINGEPGIGKTALWRHAVEECRRHGFQILLTRLAEEEMPLALVGLVDLFEHVDLDPSALGADATPFTRGRAVLDALRRTAEIAPTVIAIDDLQWLDSGSARTLRFALRRLSGEPIGLLATARPGSEATDPFGMATNLIAGRYDAVHLGPLSVGALRKVLSGTVTAISRPTLRRIHEISGGNPLYAIELARSLRTKAGAHVSTWPQLPGSLRAAIERRLQSVPVELKPLLETVSALGPTPVEELLVILNEGDAERLLAAAQEHGLLVIGDDLRIRFSHPLIGSAVYSGMSELARRKLHKRLAGRAVDPDARARHLALSTDGTDAEVAVLLEAASTRASDRGAFDLAADFARHSLRLTPDDDADSVRRRAVAEIVNLTAAGEVSRARALTARLVSTLPQGPTRAEVLIERVFVEDDDTATNESLLMEALEDAGDDDQLRAQVLDVLGWRRGMFRGDLAGGIECEREAVAIAGRMGDPSLEMLTTTGLAVMEALAGRPQPDRMQRAIALAQEIGLPVQWAGPRVWLARQLLWAGDLASARTTFENDFALRSGNEFRRPYDLHDLALVECASGDLTEAENLVQQALEAARDAEDSFSEGWLLYPLALVEAWLGRAQSARASAGRLLERGSRRGEAPTIVRARMVLGLLALSEGDPHGAARELTDAARLLDEMGVGNPGAFPVLPDAVEALAGAGDTPSAEVLLARLERQSAAVASAWGRAAAARGRGVLLLSRGHAGEAASVLEGAVDAFDELGFGPDAARAELVRGRALLRAGQRTLAAEALAGAVRRFAGMGARMWEARAAEELERAAPARSAGELTTAERRIAALVARGMKNRQIAQTLFMSVATVEAHLTRIYRKLGIRSRSDLTRLVVEDVSLTQEEVEK